MSFDKQITEQLKLQTIAFSVVKKIESQMYEGISEYDAAQLLNNEFLGLGIDRFFHKPFAWFGERTGFINFTRPLTLSSKGLDLGRDFLPRKDISLKKGMAAIFDVAPANLHAAVDIGYSFSFGPNRDHANALNILEIIRHLLPSLFESGLSKKDIYLAVDNIIEKNHYENIHQLYPRGVLGHKIGKLPLAIMPMKSVVQFSPQAILFLAQRNSLIEQSDESLPEEGFWAIEPHMRCGRFGVKFEEILVFKNKKAYWLSDR